MCKCYLKLFVKVRTDRLSRRAHNKNSKTLQSMNNCGVKANCPYVGPGSAAGALRKGLF